MAAESGGRTVKRKSLKERLRRWLFGPTFDELTAFQRALATHIINATNKGALR